MQSQVSHNDFSELDKSHRKIKRKSLLRVKDGFSTKGPSSMMNFWTKAGFSQPKLNSGFSKIDPPTTRDSLTAGRQLVSCLFAANTNFLDSKSNPKPQDFHEMPEAKPN